MSETRQRAGRGRPTPLGRDPPPAHASEGRRGEWAHPIASLGPVRARAGPGARWSRRPGDTRGGRPRRPGACDRTGTPNPRTRARAACRVVRSTAFGEAGHGARDARSGGRHSRGAARARPTSVVIAYPATTAERRWSGSERLMQYRQRRYQRVEACPRDHREPPSQRRGLATRAARRLATRTGAPEAPLLLQRWLP